MNPVNSNKRDFQPPSSTASANWMGREVTKGTASPPQECQEAFENLGKLTPPEFNITLAKLAPLERDPIIEQYAVARSHFKGEEEPLFYMKEVLTFLKENQNTRTSLLTRVIIKDLLDQMPSEKAIEIIEELQVNFKFLTPKLVQEFYIEYFVACYPERKQDALNILSGLNKAQLEKALKALIKSWTALPRKEAYTKIQKLQKQFPQFSEKSFKKSFEEARLLLEKPTKEKVKVHFQRPTIENEFWKKELLGHLNATHFEPEKAGMWSDNEVLQDYTAFLESVPEQDIEEVAQFYNNQTPLQWEGHRFPRASLLAFLAGKITIEQHQEGVKNYNQLNLKNEKWRSWELLPKPYTTLSDIEKSVSQEEIDEVAKLIDSQEGLVSSDASPIFWEDLRFPHACLCAFLQEKISLNQLVSATMVWGILQDSEIKEASLVTRKPLQEIELPCKEGEPKSEHYFYEISITKPYTVAKAVKIVGEKKLLPSPFILENNVLKIPSFSSMQLYLDEKFGEDAILLVPRWGCSTKNEIYELMLRNQRTFGIDVTGKEKPDNIVSKCYGFSLHDFYHAYRSSSIPIKHRQAFLKLANLLIENERNNEGQISIYQKDAWELIDMEFEYSETDHPDKEQTHFYKCITALSRYSKLVLLEHFEQEKLVYQNEFDIDVEPLLLLLSDEH